VKEVRSGGLKRRGRGQSEGQYLRRTSPPAQVVDQHGQANGSAIHGSEPWRDGYDRNERMFRSGGSSFGAAPKIGSSGWSSEVRNTRGIGSTPLDSAQFCPKVTHRTFSVDMAIGGGVVSKPDFPVIDDLTISQPPLIPFPSWNLWALYEAARPSLHLEALQEDFREPPCP
jgi:hypothetical protein